MRSSDRRTNLVRVRGKVRGRGRVRVREADEHGDSAVGVL